MPNSIQSYSSKRSKYLKAAKSAETERALKKHCQLYTKWAEQNKLAVFPISQAAYEAYFIHLVDLGWKRASIDQAIWALDLWHKAAEHLSPSQNREVRLFLSGIRRSIGSKQKRKKALTIEHIKQFKFSNDLLGLRDKLLLLIGFAGGLRRSELTNLKVENVYFHALGMQINLERSKTNQEGYDETVDFTYAEDSNFCPVRTLQTWLERSNIDKGYIFRSFYKGNALSSRKVCDHHVALIVKNYIQQSGLPADEYSGHSLRAGCATFLLQKKVPLNIVAKHLRHKRIDTTVKYDRNEVRGALTGLY